MDVVDRVHVAPLGHEYDRIVEPATAYRADVVYLLEHDGGTSPDAAYHDELIDDLREAGIEVRFEPCDLHDIYDVLGVVTTLAARHAADSVYVNVSSGGILAGIGATMACMDVSTDATAYYVRPESYAHEGRERPRTSGHRDETELPTYPIDSPTRQQVAVMAYLKERESGTARPKKQDIISYAESEGLPFIEERDPANDTAKFRLLENEVVGPLRADGYVTETELGRRRVVELTERGRNALRAFRHKLEFA